MADHHSNLRHGSRLLNLFRDDNNFNNSSMTMTTTSSSSMLVQNDGLPPDSSAPWSTRKTILLAEAIAVTAIVLPLVFCFLYHRASKSGHLPQSQSRSTSRAMQRNNNGVSDADAAAVMTSDNRTLRSILQEEYEAEQQQHQHLQEDDQTPRTMIQRLASLPSTLLAILSYPFHAIDAGVNSWSTANADITFLRNVMERLEEERVAQLEDVEERGERLKLAFSKGDSVWEIAEEHFVPPPTLYALSPSSPEMMAKYIGGVHNNNTATSANQDKDGLMETKIVEERELGEEEELSEEEVKRVDDNDDATNTANNAAVGAIATGTGDNEAEESDKNNEDKIDGENTNNEDKESEQNHQSSSLMMFETNEQAARSVSPLMADEDGELLTLTSPTRSSSPLDTGEAPAYLYLPNRKSRSRANTSETATTANLTSTASSSMHSQSFVLDSIPTSSSHMKNDCTQIDNPAADAANNATFVEEDELKSVPNNCAICLSEYVSGDTIVTSCDPMCTHAFHQECIIEWLVKMQVGAPCPCCRRTFVELSPSRPSAAAATVAAGGTVDGVGGDDSNTNAASLEDQERRREELRRTIQLEIRRGRTFDFSVISFR